MSNLSVAQPLLRCLAGTLFALPTLSACLGTGFQTDESVERLTPEPSNKLPDGVAQGVTLRVRFPVGVELGEAVDSYLLYTRGLGAMWFSRLRVLSAGDACVQPLMPEEKVGDADTLYIRRKDYLGGKSEQTVERRTETVRYPWIRLLDNLDGIREEVSIYRDNNRRHCNRLPTDSYVLEALVHGRDQIGLRPLAKNVDLLTCTGVDGVPQESEEVMLKITLGPKSDLRAVASTLKKWSGLRVRVVTPSQQVIGSVHAYADRIVTVKTDEGTFIPIKVLEAEHAERLELPERRPPGKPVYPLPTGTNCGGTGGPTRAL